MKRIAITGGIGSGKSFLCRLLEERGIQIYDCDDAAKRLMRHDKQLQEKLIHLVGPDTYVKGELNKPVVEQFLLASEANKQAINAIVHPAVIQDFYASGMQWMECAILFDANLQDSVDAVVCVSAPEAIRIERIMRRDNITKAKAKQWIDAQILQERVEKMSDFVIQNDGVTPMNKQIDKLLSELSKWVN